MSVRNRYSKQLLGGSDNKEEDLEYKPNKDIFPEDKEPDHSSRHDKLEYSPMITTEKLECSKIRNDLICGICRDIFLNPVTLICQHTYCRSCVKNINNKKCPMCDLAYFLPNNDNKTFESIIDTLFSEEYKQRQEHHIDEETRKDLREKIREEIRTEIQNQVISELVHRDEIRDYIDVDIVSRSRITNENPTDSFRWHLRTALNELKKPFSILLFVRLIMIIFQFQIGLYILNEIYPISITPIRNMILYLQMMIFIVISLLVFFNDILIKTLRKNPLLTLIIDNIFGNNDLAEYNS